MAPDGIAHARRNAKRVECDGSGGPLSTAHELDQMFQEQGIAARFLLQLHHQFVGECPPQFASHETADLVAREAVEAYHAGRELAEYRADGLLEPRVRRKGLIAIGADQ